MIAVLFAEYGGQSVQFARLPRVILAAILLFLAVGIAAFAGLTLAPTINAHARALVLGVALILTGCGQFGKAATGEPPMTIVGTMLFVWRSGVPFLAFAFSIWQASPVGAAAGALAGIIGAAALGSVPLRSLHRIWLRRMAGSVLLIVGGYAALWALRLL